jgi:hypothetical protein
MRTSPAREILVPGSTMIAAPVTIPNAQRHALESLRDITLVAAGIALAVLVIEVGIWIGARRAQRAVIKAQHEEAGRAAEHRSEF